MTIEDFYNHLIDNKLPESVNQESRGVGDKKYTADDWTLDVCESLIKMTNYINSNNEIRQGVDYKLSTTKILRERKDDADILCVGEVGRGLDIAIANQIKDWKEIICYDHNPVYGEYLHDYFGDKIKFYCSPTVPFIENIDYFIKERAIMILNHTRHRDFKLLQENKNIIHLIFNGGLVV